LDQIAKWRSDRRPTTTLSKGQTDTTIPDPCIINKCACAFATKVVSSSSQSLPLLRFLRLLSLAFLLHHHPRARASTLGFGTYLVCTLTRIHAHAHLHTLCISHTHTHTHNTHTLSLALSSAVWPTHKYTLGIESEHNSRHTPPKTDMKSDLFSGRRWGSRAERSGRGQKCRTNALCASKGWVWVGRPCRGADQSRAACHVSTNSCQFFRCVPQCMCVYVCVCVRASVIASVMFLSWVCVSLCQCVTHTICVTCQSHVFFGPGIEWSALV